MKKKSIINKILFITLPSIILFLITLEISLRIGGYLYMQYRHPETYSKGTVSASGTFNILCLGDSFTEGAGTGAENAYPKELERLLKENISKSINVINEGKAGSNSYLAVKKLRENINRYHPIIVVIMTGANNSWNLEEDNCFSLTNLPKFFNSIFKQLKVYKLIKIGWINCKSKINKDKKFMANNNKTHNRLTSNINPLSVKLVREGCDATTEGNNDLAIQKLETAIEVDKNNCLARLILADKYMNLQKNQLAKKEMWKVIFMINEWDDNDLIDELSCLIMRFVSQEDYKDLIRVKQYLENRYRKDKIKKLTDAIDANLCPMKQQNKLFNALEHDLKDMIKLSRKNGAAIILQTYPHSWVSNSIIRRVAYEYRVPIVDNEMIFMDKAKYIDVKFFVSDGHCNKLGYKIVAENVYNVFVRYNLLVRKAD